MATLTYQFGCADHLMPSLLPESAFSQLQLGNRFWNDLVALQRELDQKYSALMEQDEQVATIAAEVEGLQKEINGLRESIKQARKRKRTSTVHLEAEKKRLADLREKLKPLKLRLKEAKRAAREAEKAERQKLNSEIFEQTKKIRQEYAAKGLYWGNYNEILARFDAARKRLFQKRAAGQPAELKFHRFDGSGMLKVQIQGGLKVADFYSGGNGQVQVERPVDPSVWDLPRGERKRTTRRIFRIRVGSSENRQPIWFELPIILHRPMPLEGLIKEVKAVRRKNGTKWKWTVNFMVSHENTPTIGVGNGLVAIDLGWRVKDDGNIRVAYWGDEAGNTGELVLESSFVSVLKRLEGLKSVMDKRFNACKEKLLGIWDTLPGELQQLLANLPQRKSANKFSLLFFYWKDNRIPGDEEAWEIYTAWRKKHVHLWNWHLNLSQKMQGRRLDLYRRFSKEIATEYSQIVLEKFDLTRVLHRKAPEQETQKQNATIRKYARLAAVGTLRECLSNAARKYGTALVQVDGANTTRQCSVCGTLMEGVDTKPQIIIQCPNCEIKMDQDLNAVRNLLDRALDGSHTIEKAA